MLEKAATHILQKQGDLVSEPVKMTAVTHLLQSQE